MILLIFLEKQVIMGILNNNRVIDKNVTFPLVYDDVLNVKGEGFGSPLCLIDNKLYMYTTDCLHCIDLELKKIVWQKKGRWSGTPICDQDDLIYLESNEMPICFDPQKQIVRCDYGLGEVIWSVVGGKVICLKVNIRDEGGERIVIEKLSCRDKKTGDKIWSVLDAGRPTARIFVGDGIVLQGGYKGYTALSIDSGELLWKLNHLEFLKEEFSDKNFSGNLKSTFYDVSLSIGPLIDGVFYVGYKHKVKLPNTQDVLVAFNVQTGCMIWFYEFPPWNSTGTMIVKDDKLYFDLAQVGNAGSNNFLHCLDAKTGKILFIENELFTEFGSMNPVIINNYFVTGYGNRLSFYDIEKRKFVWRYQDKKKINIFQGYKLVFKDKFIAYNSVDKDIYFFRAKNQSKV